MGVGRKSSLGLDEHHIPTPSNARMILILEGQAGASTCIVWM